MHSSSKAILSCFTPGTNVWFRLRTAGIKGIMGAWSDPAMIIGCVVGGYPERRATRSRSTPPLGHSHEAAFGRFFLLAIDEMPILIAFSGMTSGSPNPRYCRISPCIGVIGRLAELLFGLFFTVNLQIYTYGRS